MEESFKIIYSFHTTSTSDLTDNASQGSSNIKQLTRRDVWLHSLLLYSTSHNYPDRSTAMVMAVNMNHEGYGRRMDVVNHILKAKGLLVQCDVLRANDS
jgi:hypothetical protein